MTLLSHQLEMINKMKGIEEFIQLLPNNNLMELVKGRNEHLLHLANPTPIQQRLLNESVIIIYRNLDKSYSPN